MSVSTPQPVLAFTKIVDLMVIILVFLAGIQLYILTEETHRYFAWTIGVPLTAAFLGAGYWGAMVSTIYAIRLTDWSRGRSTVATAFTATSLLVLATFLHLDKFHLDSDVAVTWLAAWVWVIVYVLVPPTLVYMFFTQNRVPGTNPPKQGNLPQWMRLLLVSQAVLSVVVGGALFVVPEQTMTDWPWALTPLTARAIGSWLCAVGATAVAMLWEDDLARVAGTLWGLGAFALLQLIAVLRYEGSVSWDEMAAWVYVVFLLSLLAVSVTGLWLNGRALPRGFTRGPASPGSAIP